MNFEEMKNACIVKALEDVRAEIEKSIIESVEKTSFNGSVFRCGLHEAVEIINRKIAEVSGKDCRDCKKWNDCECGKKGHDNGTSIGYSVGECAEYDVKGDKK